MGKWQDPQAAVEPIIRQIHDIWKRHGGHPHAQNKAGFEQTSVHRNDNPRKQQDPDVRIFLQPNESQIRPQMRAGLHRHRQPDLGHPDRRRVQRHERMRMDVRHIL